MSLSTGQSLGPYTIVAPLGAGGMGEVYRARDARLNRDVAIKVVPPAVAGNPEALARFERESRAVAALSHPNILTIFDVGQSNGHPYAVMELLEGETLRARIAHGPLPVRKAVEIAAQIARGLAAAHDKQIAHRDLKPDNVFLTPTGGVKILDFGLARNTSEQSDLTRSGISDAWRRRPRPAPSSARSATCRPSRCAASRAITAPTSSRSAACSTRCSPASAPTNAIPPPRRCQRFCARIRRIRRR